MFFYVWFTSLVLVFLRFGRAEGLLQREDGAVLFPCTWLEAALLTHVPFSSGSLARRRWELQLHSRLLFYSTPLCALTHPRWYQIDGPVWLKSLCRADVTASDGWGACATIDARAHQLHSWAENDPIPSSCTHTHTQTLPWPADNFWPGHHRRRDTWLATEVRRKEEEERRREGWKRERESPKQNLEETLGDGDVKTEHRWRLLSTAALPSRTDTHPHGHSSGGFIHACLGSFVVKRIYFLMD